MPRIIQKGDVTKPIASDFYFAIDSNIYGVKKLPVSDVCLKENNGISDIGGYWFDGVDDYVSQTAVNNKSIMLLIYPTRNNRAILNFGTNLNISINTSNQITFGSGFSGVTTYVNGLQTNQITLNAWNFIVCNYNEITASTLEIGRSGSSYFVGRIALVRIYNCQLTQSEITQYYNNGRPDLYALPFADRQANNTQLIGNPTFDTDTWWSKDSGITIVNGVAQFNTNVSYRVLYRFNLLQVGKRYRLEFELKNIVDGFILTPSYSFVFSTNANSQNIYDANFNTTGNKFIEFIADRGTLEFYGIVGTSTCNLQIDNVYLYQTGCVAEYRPEFAGRLGWLETQNRLHGQTFGSPVSLAVNNNEVIYRDIKTSITGNTTLTNIIPAQYRINGILVNNTTSNSVTINIGTTSNGNDVVNGLVCPAGLTFVNDAQILKKIFSLTADQTLFISSSNWNSANLNIEFGITRY